MSFATHILVATDFSLTADTALALTRDLATRFGAKVIVAHVHDPSVPIPDESGNRLETPEELAEHLKKRLALTCEQSFAGVDVRPVVLESSDVAETLCEYAKDQKVDLVVIGKSGVSGIVRMIMGSVAEEVVRHAHCSVLIAS
jgi:nucleotide-binding universal stress UspA family protein